MHNSNQEIEVRFLEIDKNALITKLHELRAQDLGEDFLKEIIFYDKELTWREHGKQFVRLRHTSKSTLLTYKNHFEHSATGTEEIEFSVSDIEKATLLLEAIGLVAVREQEKRRHTFQLTNVTVDIDTWPKIPTYVELEGESEDALKNAALKLDLDWSKAVFENARVVIEKYYNIPVGHMKYFTFDRFE